MVKQIVAGIVAAAMLVSVAGCSSSSSQGTAATAANTASDETVESTTAASGDTLSKDDFEWSVDQGQYNNKEFCLMTYTNNSPYTITNFEMRFTQKEGTTKEDREKIFAYWIENYDMDEEDFEDMYLAGYTKKLCDPGQTISGIPMYLNSFYGALDYDIYSIYEPSSMIVSFIGSDGKIHSGQIDYESGYYTADSRTDEAAPWSDSNLASLVPKVEARVIEIEFDRDDVFWIYAYGVSDSYYKDYVEKCKDKGFTEDVDEIDLGNTLSFYADDSDGNHLTVSYDYEVEEMQVDIDAAS